MNQIQPPKTRYLKTQHAKSWADAVTSDTVRVSTETALAQFVFELPNAIQDSEEASRNLFRLEGARRYMAILLNLAEKEIQKPIQMASDNLPHET